ncbi:integrase_H2C2 domain-containing protein [Trichonephila clavipes]|nr:integrase_H2C2 domain-containing protein [Trichonephila clavipes]
MKIVRRKDNENFRCPIVLPSNHLLVKQSIFENHTNTSSCPSRTQVDISNLRQQFWILRGRKTVLRVINQCCKIYTSKEVKTVPAPIPDDRVRDALVFEVTGVDLASSLYLKNVNEA